jgi:CheY-like chemotaxis protein
VADILIIDDDPQMQRMLGRILAASGHTVRFAGDGEKGLELFRQAPPGLVITDIVMPNTEGIETIRALRGDPRHFRQRPPRLSSLRQGIRGDGGAR